MELGTHGFPPKTSPAFVANGDRHCCVTSRGINAIASLDKEKSTHHTH